MSHDTPASGRRGLLTLIALVAAAAGLVLVVLAISAQVHAPQPPRAAGRIDPSEPPGSPAPTAAVPARPSTNRDRAGAGGATPLPASRPVRISIPAIGVRSRVVPIGLASDGTLAVPQPGPDLDHAAWFTASPTPGQPGPAVIEGHVDSDQGPSVFFELGALRPGDTIHVTRRDGVEAVFTVDAVRDYKKSAFPTSVVYGAKDLSVPALRLITCSDFDPTIGHHTGNAVVFAHLVSTRVGSSASPG